MVNAKHRLPHVMAGLALLATLATPTLAVADTLPWSALSDEQQATLADFQSRWDELSDSRRAQLVDRAERWRNLPDERRQAIQARWEELKAIPPEARQALRQRWNSLSPDERRQAMGAATSEGALTTSSLTSSGAN